MSEHHTQGRQGQGARHNRRYRPHSGRNRRQRMPRAEEKSAAKPSLFKRVLSFFGFGKKKETKPADRKKNTEKGKAQTPPQRVRIAQTKSQRPTRGRRPASVPPTDQARLYVGNLSFEATEAELEDLFKGFGHVRSVEIIYNSRTYRSKGYAFVEMVQLADAQRAAEVLHGQPFMGRELMVSAASEKSERREDQASAPATPAPEKSAPAEDEEEIAFGEEVVMNLAPAAEPEQSAPAPAPESEQQNA